MPRPTPAQDRQARGHNPSHPSVYPSSSRTTSQNVINKGKGKPPSAPDSSSISNAQILEARSRQKAAALANMETHEERERRDRIVGILGTWELLAWHALQNSESIPRTRLRFEKALIRSPHLRQRRLNAYAGFQTDIPASEDSSPDEWVDGFDSDEESSCGGGKKKKERANDGAGSSGPSIKKEKEREKGVGSTPTKKNAGEKRRKSGGTGGGRR
ncbi:hypothetical protein MMC09_005800 [Bachmanniomyces sp. S44760]|nr:hypothetical protein [Bachmanniomyces sp. S44760]